MRLRHMVTYHLLIPAAIFGGTLLVGFSLLTAAVAGMMAGCMSMVFMLNGDRAGKEGEARDVSEHTRA